MIMKVLGSSSKGNCYLLGNDNEILILELGLNFKEIKKGLDFKLKNVCGCLVTHEHKDHSKALLNAAQMGLDVYTSQGTKEACAADHHRIKTIKSGEQFKLGGFKILAFEAEHDAREPLGFLIQHEEMGKLLFATDTYYLKWQFEGLNHIMIECNYSEDILTKNIENNYVPKILGHRLRTSHFSLEYLKEFFKSNDLKQVREIVLLHLSEGNGDPELFLDEITKTTRRKTYLAQKGFEITMNKNPF
jgi:phosphoribosyl 1,2-cyclic phosphodiesterase